MSAADLKTADPIIAEAVNGPASLWETLEGRLDRAGDWFNPILVKEARQAMKSKQFSITFTLLLVLGWLWTALFIAMTTPAVYYAPLGTAVLTGYFIVLTVPLLIVVPYQAFRSLAAEREDGTYELLSITTLSARQIVLGKLGSAILQMIVYYSALAPCIAFTYLLRGVDVITITHLLIYTFLTSLMLSIIGLMVATVTRARHWQMVLSVLLVIVLLFAAFFWNMTMLSMIHSPVPLPYDQAEFWVAELCGLSFYISYAVLFLYIAAGQISFASENRSTPLRVVLLVQQILIIGWSCFLIRQTNDLDSIGAIVFPSTMHWVIVGMFLSGERAKLSPRALRALPQSYLGRMFLTWFNPGGVTGYVFAMTCLLGTYGIAGALSLYGYLLGMDDAYSERQRHVTLCLFGYTAVYMGFTRLFVSQLAKWGVQTSLLLSVLMQLLMAFFGCLGPLLLQAALSSWDMSQIEYTALQIPNWMWTLHEAGNGDFDADPIIPWGIFLGGISVYLLHLALASVEVEKQRAAAPQRVREEDRSLGKTRTGMLEI